MGNIYLVVTVRAMLQESHAQAAQLGSWTVTRYASHGCHEQHGHDGLWLGEQILSDAGRWILGNTPFF